MRCLEPSDTSSLVDIVTSLMIGKKNEINYNTQGDPEVSHKSVGNPQIRICRRWPRSTKYFWRNQKGLGFTNNHTYIYTFWVVKTVQWKVTWSLEDVTCLEFASRIGFDRKVSCLTYFYLTMFPTAKSEFQTRFETRSRYSYTPPETAVIVNRERINNLSCRIYIRSNWNPNTITNP